jgi:hypothetical protein
VRTRTFRQQHRDIEIRLDELAVALNTAADPIDVFRAAKDALTSHYAQEDEYFRTLVPELPVSSYKMLGQHGEVLEIAVQAEHSLEIGQMSDAMALMRRFHALAQHNIIEEERDVFPLLDGGR